MSESDILDMESDLDAVYAPPKQKAEGETITLFKEKCPKCNGTGKWVGGFSHRVERRCFKCNGVGTLEFKTSPEQREKGRIASHKKGIDKQTKAVSDAYLWTKANKPEATWMNEAAEKGNDFAKSLQRALIKYGRLTDNQIAAIRKAIARDDDWTEKRKIQQALAETRSEAVDVSRIETAFATATENSIKRPKLRLDTFTFKPAGPRAKARNVGSIYVLEDGTYRGKVQDGKFSPAFNCDPEQQQRIIDAASDPAKAAKAYGQRVGQCSCCGRELTNANSIELGIGPICAGRYGF